MQPKNKPGQKSGQQSLNYSFDPRRGWWLLQRTRRQRLWRWVGIREKKGWDWVQLLISISIPILIFLGGWWLNDAQKQREKWLNDAQKQREEHETAQRSQDAALQSYLDQMSQLLIEKESTQLHQLDPDTNVRRLMAARTSTVLERLDKGRRLAVVRFLAEAHLISKPNPVVSLTGADLSGIDFK